MWRLLAQLPDGISLETNGFTVGTTDEGLPGLGFRARRGELTIGEFATLAEVVRYIDDLQTLTPPGVEAIVVRDRIQPPPTTSPALNER